MDDALLRQIKQGPENWLHKRIVNTVQEKFRLSQAQFSSLYSGWNRIDEHFAAYISKEERDDEGVKLNPWQRVVVIPYTYSLTDTIATFQMNMLGGRRPFWQIEGRGPEDVDPAKHMAVIGDYQTCENNGMLVLYQQIMHALLYNMGFVKNIWTTRGGYRKTILREVNQMALALFGQTVETTTEVTKWVEDYAGNQAFNIDPYLAYPDPRVPVARFKEGEFFGWGFQRSYADLKRGEYLGDFFNIDKIKGAKEGWTVYTEGFADRSMRNAPRGLADRRGIENAALVGETVGIKGIYDCEELYIDLIPEQYFAEREGEAAPGLSDQPQIFRFIVANGAICIDADDTPTAQFPFELMQSTYDNTALLPPGLVELIMPMQKQLEWFVNSHIDSVMRTVNNRFAIDPTMLNAKDVLKNGHAMLVRVMPAYYGNPIAIEKGIKQLDVVDVTQGHMRDVQVLENFMQMVSGANLALMGMPEGGRRTKGEHFANINQASNRLKKMADIFTWQGLTPLIKQQVANTQAFMKREQFFRVLGKIPGIEQTVDRILLGPQDIQGNFDFPIRVGRMQLDPENAANVWQQLLVDASQNPLLAQQIPILWIFEQLAESLGVPNIPKPPVIPAGQEAIQQGLAAGQISPARDALEGMQGRMLGGQNGKPMMPPGAMMGMMGGMGG